MMRLLNATVVAVVLGAGVAALGAGFAEDASLKAYDLKASEPKVTEEEWQKYDKTLDERGDKAVADAAIADPEKAAHAKASLIAWYKLTRAWHARHDEKLKALNKDAKGNAEEIAKIRETLKPYHEAFVADLASFLTPEQVDAIKEYLTYKRPSIMATGFAAENPWLNEEQKSHIKQIANDSREAAMDEGSSDAKHKVMDKYKGRITNYIAQEKKKAATQPSTAPAN